jgi:alpha-1,2-mannosyltransferase/arabinofuranan 3-O-arabinosyltransferase
MDKAVSFRIWDAVLFVAALGVMLFTLGMYAYLGFGTLEVIAVGSMGYHADFDTFWRSAEALLSGGDIYDTGGKVPNLNPPFWTVLISPLGLLKGLTAYRLFVILMLLTSIGYLTWMATELRLRAAWAIVGVAMLLVSTPLAATLSLGQIYPFLALGLVAAWVADHRGKPVVSGLALGLVIAIKPSLAPIALWPLLRKRWDMLGAALISGVVATLIGIVVVGPEETLDWLQLLGSTNLSGTWHNASLPGTAARLFRGNSYNEPLVTFPSAINVAFVLGIEILILTAAKVRRDPEMGLWALVAASLLASPIAWYDYVVLLGPGILLLLARGRTSLALLLLALQAVPAQWHILWQDTSPVLTTLALTLYLYILLAHWLALLTGIKEPAQAKEELVLGSAKPTVETVVPATHGASG